LIQMNRGIIKMNKEIIHHETIKGIRHLTFKDIGCKIVRVIT